MNPTVTPLKMYIDAPFSSINGKNLTTNFFAWIYEQVKNYKFNLLINLFINGPFNNNIIISGYKTFWM
jgi:hypothetical protein